MGINDEQNQRIQSLEKQVDSLSEEISSLKKINKALSEEVHSLKAKVGQLVSRQTSIVGLATIIAQIALHFISN